ncbi:hypothetical protein IEQ34_010180 [Dendrobium chrysotoxum]|uniref:Uncharacterized protein n=1 Tax=Dendrobium chrysotoxum TaxID=161865 RepID=A0AAV7H526_DENCH|nr:hypothetical protein IEQ34_010180 [Dendrobium chrysotoxum]
MLNAKAAGGAADGSRRKIRRRIGVKWRTEKCGHSMLDFSLISTESSESGESGYRLYGHRRNPAVGCGCCIVIDGAR